MTGEQLFKKQLEQYFPDLYQFWSLFPFDPFYQQVMDASLEMVKQNGFGTLKVYYQNGKINYVTLEKQLTANKSNQPLKSSDV